MKKTKLTRSLLAACSIVALSAVMYGCVHGGGDDAPATDMSGTPDPVPEPDPGPTDLDETQTAAAAAAAAAMTASDNAAASASSAAEATATLATLQTGADSNSGEMGGREAAYAAHAAAKDAADAAAAAADASAAAAAATTGAAGEAAWRMAVAAQETAEAAETMAATMAAAAMTAAMTELHIDGTVKTVGESSLDAAGPEVISQDRMKDTGFQRNVSRSADAVEGQHFIQPGAATETKYKQAVAAGSINIGKTVDTSDDAARVTVFHSHQDSKTVRAFVDGNGEAIDPTLGGFLADEVTGLDGYPLMDLNNAAAGDQFATVKSIGMYYLANDRATLPAATVVEGDPGSDPGAGASSDGALNAYDQVDLTDGGQPHEIFELSDGTNTYHARVVETITDDQGNTARHYEPVDIMANLSMTDGDDPDATPDHLRPVTVAIPVATEYSHIHFGLWAGLNATGSAIDALGIGFVQNIDGSGMTARQGIGSATYNGDWVAAVRRQYASDADAGAITMHDGKASMTANFEDNEFSATLAGLATLEGTLSGNGFSGTKATAMHDDLDARQLRGRVQRRHLRADRLGGRWRLRLRRRRSRRVPRRLRRDSVANPAILGSNQYRRPVRQRVGRLFLTPSRRNSHAS